MPKVIIAAKNRSDLAPSVLVLVLFFVLIYYCGYRLKTGFVSEIGHWDIADKKVDLSMSFLVNDDVCQIPKVHPFAPDLEYIAVPPVHCATELQRKKPLISKLWQVEAKSYYLHINEKWKSLYFKKSMDINCCSKIINDTGNWDNKTSDRLCYNFTLNFYVPQNVIGIIVNCMQRGDTKILYEDAFSFVHKKKFNLKPVSAKKTGVLLLGIDSLSQINFQRRMPKTHNYLRSHKHQWHQMMGYNKLDYDALPNLIALLTGYKLENLSTLCDYKKFGALDTCPLLWHVARTLHMPTAYAEDIKNQHTQPTGTFKFLKPPIDYYLQPFMAAIGGSLNKQYKFISPQFCRGPRFTADYVLDYALEFAESFTGHGGLGIFWLNTFREHYNESTVFDYKFPKYLEVLHEKQILENYVVLLLSGNGMLQGRLNKLASSFYQERIPLLYISLPITWRFTHPELLNALHLNRHRLISALDLHLTVKHALELGAGVELSHNATLGCRACQSVLTPIPPNRDCSDIGIAWLSCACEPFTAKLCNSHATHVLMNTLLTHMNELLHDVDLLNGTCRPLHLHTLYGIYNSQRQSDYYYVKFKTLRTDADFEIAFWFDSRKLTVSLDERKLNRLDDNAKDCASEHSELYRKLCVCA